MMRRCVVVLLLSGLGTLPALGAARDWQTEITHLLDFIEESGCSFVRNGKEYDSVEARAHISKKYDYVKKRISSAEQFIAYAASKSSITGTPYQVTCGEATMPSSAWLEEALQRYRAAH